jgi:hypothetical protein
MDPLPPSRPLALKSSLDIWNVELDTRNDEGAILVSSKRPELRHLHQNSHLFSSTLICSNRGLDKGVRYSGEQV